MALQFCYVIQRVRLLTGVMVMVVPVEEVVVVVVCTVGLACTL